MDWIKLSEYSVTSYVMVGGKRNIFSNGLVDYSYRLYVYMDRMELFAEDMGNLIYLKNLSFPHPPLKQILHEVEQIITLYKL